MYPFNNNDLKPEIPDVDYEVDTFGARTSRKAWIDNKIIAVLDKPEIFNREGMVPFGLDNEPKGLIGMLSPYHAWPTTPPNPNSRILNNYH